MSKKATGTMNENNRLIHEIETFNVFVCGVLLRRKTKNLIVFGGGANLLSIYLLFTNENVFYK